MTNLVHAYLSRSAVVALALFHTHTIQYITDTKLENSMINSSIFSDGSLDTHYDAYQRYCENGVDGKSKNPSTNTSELDIEKSDLDPKMEEIQRRQIPQIKIETRKSKNASDFSSLNDTTSDEIIKKKKTPIWILTMP